MGNPAHLKYTADHEWLEICGEIARVGISAFAADALGDVVYVQLPEVGTTLSAGETCGELESTKSVNDLFSPAAGEVLDVNQAVIDDPGLLNKDPFGEGWLFILRISGSMSLLDAAAYSELVEA